ncbi:hypothetical protein KP509_09G090400 [Ceratopteris richardii]|uniref:phosphoribosylanthranilate isomerase n=1 Tax=Ceratopteris richardii TaxID=49495 RepID=A0A8T2U901_CERRI|nr:hypothetical protein KP509_09G090400 [Ceratopteris richardii]
MRLDDLSDQCQSQDGVIVVFDDLEVLLQVLPADVRDKVSTHPRRAELLEVVLDLDRQPEARFLGDGGDEFLRSKEITRRDLNDVQLAVEDFGGDNRAGTESTLQRTSAIQSRKGAIVGLTCRLVHSEDAVKRKQTKTPIMQQRWMEVAAYSDEKTTDADSQTMERPPAVKICGVTNVNDGLIAAQAGATFVGMILWPNSKRSVSIHAAKEIAHAVRMHGAEPVGVFVDENAETIERWCKETNINIAQSLN